MQSAQHARSCPLHIHSARLPLKHVHIFLRRRASVQGVCFSPCKRGSHLREKRQIICNANDIASSPEEAIAAEDGSAVYKAHIDWKYIRDNLPGVKANVANRNSSALPDKVVELYDHWRGLQTQAEDLRTERNANAKAMKGKMEAEKREELVAQGKELKDRLAELETEVDSLEVKLQLEGQKLPNLTHPDVPVGDESAAVVISESGKPADFPFRPKDHLQLGEELDLLDFEAGAEVSGRKFVYLKNAAAMLELALCNYAMQKAVAKGFTPMITPDLVRESVLKKCGFQPRAENTQVYSVENSTLCLTGTAEVPLGAYYMDQILPEEQLPIKLVAFGHCFRTEAGAAGSADRGLYRVHQFSKVEMFVVSTPEQSEGILRELCQIEEEIFQELGLHYKVLDMPTGDLGAPAYRKLDIEAWMPGIQRYGEISSASNCTDYQSRRLNIRYRPAPKEDEDKAEDKSKKKKKKKVPTEFVHTLNATACAVPRMIVAILENFQQEDGTVQIPEVLQAYMAGQKTITPS